MEKEHIYDQTYKDYLFDALPNIPFIHHSNIPFGIY